MASGTLYGLCIIIGSFPGKSPIASEFSQILNLHEIRMNFLAFPKKTLLPLYFDAFLPRENSIASAFFKIPTDQQPRMQTQCSQDGFGKDSDALNASSLRKRGVGAGGGTLQLQTRCSQDGV